MTVIDLAVLVIGGLAAWSGWRSGGVHSAVGILGRLLGLGAGLWVAHLVADTSWSFLVRVGVEVAVVLAGLVVGGRVARALAPVPVQPSAPDRVVGAVVRGGVGVVVAVLVVGALALWAPGEAGRAAADSRVAAVTGPQLSSFGDDLRASLPSDLDGVIPSGTSSTASARATLSETERAATVQVLATSPGTSSVSEGSGFVVAGGRVVTAHHVVTGRSTVTVVAADGRHDATVTADDARADVTVLTVDGLGSDVVPVSAARIAAGTPAVVAGFPGGGPLVAGTATVVGGVAMPAVGTSGLALRPAYRLDAVVRPGNSGGPLYDTDGAVIGMIDARSLTEPDVGFAITTEPVIALLAASA